MNKYERGLLTNLKLGKALYGIIFILNIFLPLFKPSVFGYKCPTQYVLLIVQFLGLLGMQGYLTDQYIPILPIVFIRLIQFVTHTFIFKAKVNTMIFLVLSIIDFIFIMLLIIDKDSYVYIKEDS